MDNTHRRRFNLLDAAILIAVAAIFSSWLRSDSGDLGSLAGLDWARKSFGHIHGTVWWINANASRLAIPCTLGVLAMRLRHPRPPRARLWRQPGFVALAAATIALSMNFASAIFYPELPNYTASGRFAWRFWEGDGKTDQVAAAVAASWFILAFSRRWRPEPGWVDRAGTAVGLAWLVLLVAENYFLATH